jgi:hypothetical protein
VSELDEVHAALDPSLSANEAVYQGYLLHYADGSRLAAGDEDLKLLAGDAFYALGLARLAESGDLPAVAELADLITGCARAHAEGDPEAASDLWSQASR